MYGHVIKQTKHLDAIKSNHIIHIFSAARLRSRWNFCKPPMRWHLGPTIELCMIIFLDGRVLSRNPTIWNPTRNLRGMWNPPQNCSNLFFCWCSCVHGGLVFFVFKSLEVFEMMWKASKVCKGVLDDRISKRHTSYDSCRIPVGICV